MTKKKTTGLEDWVLKPGHDYMLHVRVHLSYPDVASVQHIRLEERKDYIAGILQTAFAALIRSNYFQKYTLIGSRKKPRGIKTTIPLSDLEKVTSPSCIESVIIDKIDGVRKRVSKAKHQQSFYCVKMIAAIEIEGQTNGMQTYEERFVLINASSSNDACDKIWAQKDDYAQPYLNGEGAIVRWVIERIDDCYETGIIKSNEFNATEGTEVYSKLKSRKRNHS